MGRVVNVRGGEGGGRPGSFYILLLCKLLEEVPSPSLLSPTLILPAPRPPPLHAIIGISFPAQSVQHFSFVLSARHYHCN